MLGEEALVVEHLDVIDPRGQIVVNDVRGFYANRCVGNYIREGHLMLMEGVPPAMIEAAMTMPPVISPRSAR